MLYFDQPNNFNPAFEAVSCIFSFKDEILLLKRSEKVEFSAAYGAPTGKVNNGEQLTDAMMREILEETGLEISKKYLQFLNTFYVQYHQYDFIYHLYAMELDEKPTIHLNPREHTDFKWVKKTNAYTLSLVPDMKPCLEYFLLHESKVNLHNTIKR